MRNSAYRVATNETGIVTVSYKRLCCILISVMTIQHSQGNTDVRSLSPETDHLINMKAELDTLQTKKKEDSPVTLTSKQTKTGPVCRGVRGRVGT